MSDNSSVQVALRIRPLVPSETERNCKSCIDVYRDLNQVKICDKAFTFNHVFDSETSQDDFYKKSVEGLVPNLFKGYNVTILAYGQTGSGKTHSMGTAYNGQGEMGIIPRAVHDIFLFIKDNFIYDFNVKVSFVELYQEVLYDLLSNKPRAQCVMDVREDVNKGIFIPGLTENDANSTQEVLDYLQQGSKGRATSSTNMNAQSSRSHAIFTISINMSKKDGSDCKTAKFHLVDLAGSERPKKTGATGQTFKEGVTINKGLFVLGNVISALGDDKGAPTYVNYRESILTRLLKDSLGGNSITMMVACVSPAAYNSDETLSTLRYADRARRIKNKPVVNEDPKAGEISKLRKENQQLRLQLNVQGGSGVSQSEFDALKCEISKLKNKLHLTVTDNVAMHERMLLIQTANEGIAHKFQSLQDEYATTMEHLDSSMNLGDLEAIKNHRNALKTIETHIIGINNDTMRSEAEMKSYDRTIAKDTEAVSYITKEEIDEQQENHMTKQIAINQQLQHVTKMLAQKEDLAKQIALCTAYSVNLDEMTDNQNKIADLEKEKNELMQQLKQAQAQGASGKLAEQRRKRVQELESQLHVLNRKVQEQARMIKLKEKDELKIKKLNLEITGIKSEKVKLVRTMRQESERYRKWKLDRERELSKFQSQDRKRLNEMATMKRQHAMNENVLKRKLADAAATSKRLRDALALRKNVQDAKLKGKVERFGPWLHQELTIHVNLAVAQAAVKTLLEDRTTLQEQVDSLKQSENPENEEEIRRLEEQIEMRNVQIQDFNQELIQGKDEERARTRFDNVQTMAEAKYSLNALFEMTAEFKKHEIEVEHKADDLQREIDEMKLSMTDMQGQLDDIKNQNDVAMNEIENDNQEKTMLLLKQLRGVEMQDIDKQAQHRIDALESMNAKLEGIVEAQQSRLDEQQSRIEELTALVESTAKGTELAAMTTPPKKIKRSGPKVPMRSAFEESFNTSYEDDVENDPDWRHTPLGKQVRAMRETSLHVQTLKRSVSGGCGCKGSCSTRSCACRRVNTGCSSFCKCKVQTCVNREKSMEDGGEQKESTDVNTCNPEDVSFKKPRLTGENMPLKKNILKKPGNTLTVPEKAI